MGQPNCALHQVWIVIIDLFNHLYTVVCWHTQEHSDPPVCFMPFLPSRYSRTLYAIVWSTSMRRLNLCSKISIDAPKEGKSTTAVGAFTHLQVKGLQLKLNQLSFYYHDLTATVGPKEFAGFAEITLLAEGIDVDIKVRAIPNTTALAGYAERAEWKRFLRIDHVEVHVSDNDDVHVTESNHPVLFTVFHPLLTACLRGALDDVEREHPERHGWCRCARVGHRCAACQGVRRCWASAWPRASYGVEE